MQQLSPSTVKEMLKGGLRVRVGNYRKTPEMRHTIRVLTCAGIARRVSPWRGDWASLVPGSDPYTADTGNPLWTLHAEDLA